MNSKIYPRKVYTYPDTPFKSKGIVSGTTKELKTEAPAGWVGDDNYNYLEWTGDTMCGLVNITGRIILPVIKLDAQGPAGYHNNIYRGVLNWYILGTTEHGSIHDYFNLETTIGKEYPYCDFNLYFKFTKPGIYDMCMSFYTTGGEQYSRRFRVEIIDNASNNITLYSISKKEIKDEDFEHFAKTIDIDELLFQMSYYSGEYAFQSQFIYTHSNKNYIGLNHTVAFVFGEKYVELIEIENSKHDKIKINGEDDSVIEPIKEMFPEYWWFDVDRPMSQKDFEIGNKHHILIGICKIFNKTPLHVINDNVIHNSLIHNEIRFINEFRFYPGLHTKTQFDGCVIEPTDVICAIPNITDSKEIRSYHWEFVNVSTGKIIHSSLYIPNQLIKPDGTYNERAQYFGNFGNYYDKGGCMGMVLADTEKNKLEPGYYDIILHYRTGNTEQKIQCKSSFYIQK